MGRLDDKVCVITGAASGIGAETARLFKGEGATVVGVDLRDDSPGVDLALACDVADDDAVREMFAAVRAEYDRIDVLFNNAGISPPEDASVLETELDVWERIQAVNVRSVFLCCKHGIPHLLETGGGSVINTASFVAVMGAATSQIAYTASKGAVLSLSRELGVEFARRGVRVNALCPGPVNTPLLEELFAKRPREGGAAPRARADGPLRGGARDRQRRAVPGLRRVLLRERDDLPGRRRALQRLHHAGRQGVATSRPAGCGSDLANPASFGATTSSRSCFIAPSASASTSSSV